MVDFLPGPSELCVPTDPTYERQEDMALASRTLQPGERLAANYRGKTHAVDVIESDSGGIAFQLDTGEVFTSMSAAGSRVMGGISCNGWRFWSRSDDLRPPRQTAASQSQITRRPKPQPYRNLRPIPSASGTPPAWWCSACLAPFTQQDPAPPIECPHGHPVHMNGEQVEVAS